MTMGDWKAEVRTKVKAGMKRPVNDSDFYIHNEAWYDS